MPLMALMLAGVAQERRHGEGARHQGARGMAARPTASQGCPGAALGLGPAAFSVLLYVWVLFRVKFGSGLIAN